MGKTIEFTNIKTVISKFKRDFDIEDIDESTLIEWASEAVEHLEVNPILLNKAVILKIDNFTSELPKDFKYELSVHKLTENEVEELCENSVQTTENVVNNSENTNINEYFLFDCCGNPIKEEHEKQYQPYLKLWIVVNKSDINSKAKETNRLEKVNIFNIRGKSYADKDGYYIKDKIIKTTFEKGNVLVLYKSMPTDEYGYPLIINDVSYLNAVSSYLIMMYTRKMWILGRQGFDGKYKYMQAEWNWYLQQAKNKFYMPFTEDDYINFGKYIHSHLKKYRK